ncbi:phragmoplast-associated kinesin-related protein [Artemisia annua]|uniref:Kinesin-like protein n=1 Tax=Artemisia annua TaxID=35608 RepID=A0A2U1NSR5_ARTAN|nr:phragmoplast-associated kinesin-related protein [Artemisia annua]
MKSRKQNCYKENVLPSDKNIIPDSFPSQSSARKPTPNLGTRLKSPFPPRPNFPNQKKLFSDPHHDNDVSGSSSTAVKVIVRMRPLKEHEGEAIVKMTSGDTLSILGQRFTFDAVADAKSTQASTDIFQLVGAPLVEKCLAGEQKEHADKELMYQCSCSFLEIYNEQITGLLNPSERNLQIRECPKSGVCVQNLTKETICNMDDVTQILKKRDGLSCFKTSRMNLVDLAGAERQEATGATGERQKEARNINRSLTQLGYANLFESLGGNAELAIVCAVSPAQSCKNETVSTLRFAQRAKTIKTKAVVNEQTHEDVSKLQQVIRQLKDEVILMKSNQNQAESSAKWNPHRSLQLIKFSLSYPMSLPHGSDDGDVEMEIIDEEEDCKPSVSGSQLVPTDGSQLADSSKQEVEKVWADNSKELVPKVCTTYTVQESGDGEFKDVENPKMEPVSEKKCCKELKEALQMAMEGQARILELYTNLQEKHSNLLRSRCCCQGTHKEA